LALTVRIEIPIFKLSVGFGGPGGGVMG